MYRVLAAAAESRPRRNQLRQAAPIPESLATRLSEPWSFDIATLPGPAKWTDYYLYVILDIFAATWSAGWPPIGRAPPGGAADRRDLRQARDRAKLLDEQAAQEMLPLGSLGPARDAARASATARAGEKGLAAAERLHRAHRVGVLAAQHLKTPATCLPCSAAQRQAWCSRTHRRGISPPGAPAQWR